MTPEDKKEISERVRGTPYNLPMGPLEVLDFTGIWSILVASEQDAMRELGPEKGKLHPLIRVMHRAGYTKICDFWKDVMSKW